MRATNNYYFQSPRDTFHLVRSKLLPHRWPCDNILSDIIFLNFNMCLCLYIKWSSFHQLVIILLWKWKLPSPIQLFAPHGLYSPWNSPGQNTGVGSLSLLQGIFQTQESKQDLLHCRWILYQLSYQGSPGNPPLVHCKSHLALILSFIIS